MRTILETLTLLLATAAAVDYESLSTEPRYKASASHYLDFPVMRKDFAHWSTMGAAVILKSRLVLTPEIKDRKGIIYSKVPNSLDRHWLLDLELDLGNQAKTSRGGTGLGLFYLKSVDQVSHKESIFGYSNRFEGLGIYLNTIIKSETRGSNKEILNAIQGYYNDGTRAINVFTDKKHICYKHIRNLPQGQLLKLRVMYDAPLLTLQVYDLGTQTFELCFSFEADLSFPGYFLLSGASGVHNPDHIFVNSIKLYDPLNTVSNDHFQEVRRKKAENEAQEAGKDLLQDHRPVISRNISELYALIPQQHNLVQHRLQEFITDYEQGNQLFFETLKGLPQNLDYTNLKEKLYLFKISVETLNSQIEKESQSLSEFDKMMKKVRYSTNLQRGLQQREVINTYTQQTRSDIQDIEENIRTMTLLFKDYKQVIQTLGEKIKNEEGFTARLEAQRRQFAQEESSSLAYDLKDIDDFFNQMELEVLSAGAGWSTLIVRVGMVVVIAFSAILWFKMNKYESKNE